MIHTQIITCEEYDSFDEMMGAELFVNLKIVNLKIVMLNSSSQVIPLTSVFYMFSTLFCS